MTFNDNVVDRHPRYHDGRAFRDGALSVAFRRCEDSVISGNQFMGVWRQPAGLVLEGCRRVNVVGCNVLDSDNAGVMLKDCAHCKVSNCLIRDDRSATTDPVAIRVEGGQGNFLTGNLVRGKLLLDPAAGFESGNHATP